MRNNFNEKERVDYRAELGASVQEAKRHWLVQRIAGIDSGIMEFYNKNHGKDGRFGAGKSSGGGSLSDKRAAYRRPQR